VPARRRLVSVSAATFCALAVAVGPATLASTDVDALADSLPPDVDPISYVLPEHMTWDDYRPVPGYDWTNPAYSPPKKIRAALILADFEDQEFVAKERGFTDDPADFYKRFLITEPSELNNFHTVDEYWLEDSYGLVGIDAEAFGPYRMPGKLHEYGLTSDMNDPRNDCPSGDTCNRDLDTAMLQASAGDTAAEIARSGKEFAFRWLLHAGFDESGTWEEFGPMLFSDPEDVTDEVDERVGQSLGNPDPDKPNAAKTRYQRPDGAWTSFFSAKQPWAHAVPGVYSTQGESDGQSTFAHELSHIFGVLDNYGNPFAANADRDYSGPWDMLSRGTFNGPGGPHTRYRVPSDSGGTMGAHHMLRTKVRLGFVAPTDVNTFPKSALSAGPVITDVLQREQPMTANMRLSGLKYGVSVLLGRDTGDTACPRPGNARCDGGGYDDYTVEVVNRVGYDSFTPDAGVLIAKTKKADLLPFLWVVDSHPDDIGAIDYVKPDGTPQPYRFGDYRQLSDALFKAGRTGTHELGKGLAKAGETSNSYEDTGNGLKFLVLGKKEDSAGVLSYRVAVLSATPSPLLQYGVTVAPVPGGGQDEQRFAVTNTGSATDIVRVTPTADRGAVKVLNDLVELKAGETKVVTVHTAGAPSVSLEARSEGDTSKTAGAVAGAAGFGLRR
jgi:M6 family metalloprotease-like protein